MATGTSSELRQPNEVGSLPQETFCGFQESEGTLVNKWDFIVLTSEVTNVFESFLGYN